MSDQLLDLVILHDDELKKLRKALPGLRASMEKELAAKVAELATKYSEEAKAELALFSGISRKEIEGLARLELTAHAGQIRTDLMQKAEQSFAALLVKHEGMVAEMAPKIIELAKAAASEVTREYSVKQPDIPEMIKRELAATVSAGQMLLGANKGDWKANKTYHGGDIVAFRGSSYLVLRKTPRGEFPSVSNQKDANPLYQILAAAGAPGPRGSLDAGSAFGTLPIGNGGTGATSFTQDALITGNGTSPLTSETVTLTATAMAFPSTVTSGLQLYNTADQTTNYERLEALWSSNVAQIRTAKGGSGTLRNLNVSTGSGNPAILFRSGSSSGGSLTFSSVTTAGAGDIGFAFGGHTNVGTSGTNVMLSITPTYNQASGTAANTDLLINRTQTAVGSGAQLLADFQVGGTSQVSIDNGAKVTFKTGTTSAVGLQWASDVNIYRRAPGVLAIAGSASPEIDLVEGSTTRAEFYYNGSTNIRAVGSQSLILSTNSTAALTLSSAQAATFAGALITTPQALSGAGAVNTTTSSTFYTSTGGAQALTLANGTSGQIKTIVHQVDGGSGVLTPTSAIGFTTVTFTNVGDSVTLQYTPAGWAIVGIFGAVAA